MDNSRFDDLSRRVAVSGTRRGTLRLLASGLLGALLAQHGGALVRAQDLDSDQDGLFDDDELNIYGTKPDVVDTDGDGVGDGQEICNRDGQDPNCQQDQVHTNPLVNENAAAPPADGGGAAPAPTCIALGGACSGIDLPCCGNDPATFGYNNVVCCPTDLTGGSACTDIAGTFLCPDPAAVPASGCPEGWTNCGGVCTDLATNHGNCGSCGNRCSQVCGPDCNCVSATCTRTCATGLTSCSGVCVDTRSDFFNCGRCGRQCPPETADNEVARCRDGECWISRLG